MAASSMCARSRRARSFLAAAFALALSACSGGGGGGSPTTFTFATAADGVDEDSGPLAVDVVLHTTLAALTEEASVEVFDLGTGTAGSGSDYQAFATQTLTFPAGTVDGATQPVQLTPLDDLLIEGRSETALLRLRNPTHAGLSGMITHTVTIGDVHSAAVLFTAAASSTPDEHTGTQNVALELDVTPPGAVLGVALTARASDLRTGTASAGRDYTAFSAQTITFPIGSGDGTILTLAVQIVDDSTIEGDETVELGLSSPSAGLAIGNTNTHALTIQDDDAGGDPAFLAAAGATGTENSLAFDELVNLGAETVAEGPNAGTLLRVTNAGGGAMQLGPPVVSGAHVNDFAVTIDTASLVQSSAELGLDAPDAFVPLVAHAVPVGAAPAFEIVPERVAELARRTRTTLHGLSVPGIGPVVLDLRRVPLPIDADSVLAVDGVPVPGGLAAVVGDLQVWSGSVLGLQDSRAFLSFSSTGLRGFLELPTASERFVHLDTGPDGLCRIARAPLRAALDLAGEAADFCKDAPPVPGGALAFTAPPGTSALTVAGCRLALETDFQLFNVFGSTGELSTYVTELIAAVGDRYYLDVQTRFSIAYLGVHSSVNDGWTSQDSGGDSLDLLNEFQAAWGTTWPASADLAHFLSGANLGGGVAYVGVLCNPSFGFGVSGNLVGTIDWDTWNGAPSNFAWDFVVVAHEIGHNFGSQHTHAYCPPLDNCFTNCSGPTACPRGTIMSYCHLCGGMDNIDLLFHPVTANIMRQSVNLSCLAESNLPGGNFVQYRVQFNPLTAAGIRTAALSFTHDATNTTQPFRVQLTGTASF